MNTTTMPAPPTSELFVCGPQPLDTTTRRRLLAANNPHARLLVFQPQPARSRRAEHEAAIPFLDALGARYGGRDTHAARDWTDDTVAWLTAYRIRDTVVLDADFLDAETLTRMADIAAQARIRAWLVLENDLDETQTQFLEDWCLPSHHHAGIDQLPVYTSAHDISPSTHADTDGVDDDAPTELPDSDPLTFLNTCRRVLTDTQYRWVEPRYVDALRRAHDALDDTPVGDLDTLSTHILNSIRTTTSSTHVLVTERAYQASCAERRIRLSVDTWTLTEANESRTRRRAAVVGAGTHRTTTVAALVALAETGFSNDEIVAVTVADYDPVRATVTVDAHPVPIPPEYVPSLAAARMHHLQRAHPSDHQLVGGPNEPLDMNAVGRRLSRARIETGTELAYGRTRSPRAARTMLRTYGIRLSTR